VTAEPMVLVNLRSAVQRLAAPADEQVRHLVELGSAPSADELALEFDDFFRPAVGALGDSVPARRLMLRLADLDDLLRALSERDDPELWTTAALETSPDWADVRERAAAALREFA
jgi:hypothetical protein